MSKYGDGNPLDRALYSAAVYQAQGMVGVQLGCSMADALAAMETTATATDGTVEEIAVLVLSGELRFDGSAN